MVPSEAAQTLPSDPALPQWEDGASAQARGRSAESGDWKGPKAEGSARAKARSQDQLWSHEEGESQPQSSGLVVCRRAVKLPLFVHTGLFV